MARYAKPRPSVLAAARLAISRPPIRWYSSSSFSATELIFLTLVVPLKDWEHLRLQLLNSEMKRKTSTVYPNQLKHRRYTSTAFCTFLKFCRFSTYPFSRNYTLPIRVIPCGIDRSLRYAPCLSRELAEISRWKQFFLPPSPLLLLYRLSLYNAADGADDTEQQTQSREAEHTQQQKAEQRESHALICLWYWPLITFFEYKTSTWRWYSWSLCRGTLW